MTVKKPKSKDGDVDPYAKHLVRSMQPTDGEGAEGNVLKRIAQVLKRHKETPPEEIIEMRKKLMLEIKHHVNEVVIRKAQLLSKGGEAEKLAGECEKLNLQAQALLSVVEKNLGVGGVNSTENLRQLKEYADTYKKIKNEIDKVVILADAEVQKYLAAIEAEKKRADKMAAIVSPQVEPGEPKEPDLSYDEKSGIVKFVDKETGKEQGLSIKKLLDNGIEINEIIGNKIYLKEAKEDPRDVTAEIYALPGKVNRIAVKVFLGDNKIYDSTDGSPGFANPGTAISLLEQYFIKDRPTSKKEPVKPGKIDNLASRAPTVVVEPEPKKEPAKSKAEKFVLENGVAQLGDLKYDLSSLIASGNYDVTYDKSDAQVAIKSKKNSDHAVRFWFDDSDGFIYLEKKALLKVSMYNGETVVKKIPTRGEPQLIKRMRAKDFYHELQDFFPELRPDISKSGRLDELKERATVKKDTGAIGVEMKELKNEDKKEKIGTKEFIEGVIDEKRLKKLKEILEMAVVEQNIFIELGTAVAVGLPQEKPGTKEYENKKKECENDDKPEEFDKYLKKLEKIESKRAMFTKEEFANLIKNTESKLAEAYALYHNLPMSLEGKDKKREKQMKWFDKVSKYLNLKIDESEKNFDPEAKRIYNDLQSDFNGLLDEVAANRKAIYEEIKRKPTVCAKYDSLLTAKIEDIGNLLRDLDAIPDSESLKSGKGELVARYKNMDKEVRDLMLSFEREDEPLPSPDELKNIFIGRIDELKKMYNDRLVIMFSKANLPDVRTEAENYIANLSVEAAEATSKVDSGGATASVKEFLDNEYDKIKERGDVQMIKYQNRAALDMAPSAPSGSTISSTADTLPSTPPPVPTMMFNTDEVDAIESVPDKMSPESKTNIDASTLENNDIVASVFEASLKKYKEAPVPRGAHTFGAKEVPPVILPADLSMNMPDKIFPASMTAPSIPVEKKTMWQKVRGFFGKTAEGAKTAAELVKSKEGLLATAGALYRIAATTAGVKIITDTFGLLPGAVGKIFKKEELAKYGWGDINKKIVSSREIKAEKSEISKALQEIMANGDKIEDKIQNLREKISASNHISSQDRDQLEIKLMRVAESYRAAAEAEAKERDEKIAALLGVYMKNKVDTMVIAKDALDTVFTLAGLSAVRFGSRAVMRVGGRLRKAAAEREKQQIENTGEAVALIGKHYFDDFKNAFVETARGLALQGAKEGANRKQKAVDFARSFGTVATALGITGLALSDTMMPSEAAEHLVEKVSDQSVWCAVKENFVNNIERALNPIDALKHRFGAEESSPAVHHAAQGVAIHEAIATAPAADQISPDLQAHLDKFGDNQTLREAFLAEARTHGEHDLDKIADAYVVHKGDGLERIIQRQLLLDPEKFGLHDQTILGDPEKLQHWAGHEARVIAVKNNIDDKYFVYDAKHPQYLVVDENKNLIYESKQLHTETEAMRSRNVETETKSSPEGELRKVFELKPGQGEVPKILTDTERAEYDRLYETGDYEGAMDYHMRHADLGQVYEMPDGTQTHESNLVFDNLTHGDTTPAHNLSAPIDPAREEFLQTKKEAEAEMSKQTANESQDPAREEFLQTKGQAEAELGEQAESKLQPETIPAADPGFGRVEFKYDNGRIIGLRVEHDPNLTLTKVRGNVLGQRAGSDFSRSVSRKIIDVGSADSVYRDLANHGQQNSEQAERIKEYVADQITAIGSDKGVNPSAIFKADLLKRYGFKDEAEFARLRDTAAGAS